MAQRPIWQGHLRLSLVTCPVALYTAVNASADVRFHLINPKTDNRIRMVPTDPDTGPVERSDLVRGYEVSKDRYVLLEDDEIAGVKLESTRVIDISRFAPAGEVDPIYLDHPYFIVPQDGVAAEAFGVIREAMEKAGTTALGRVVLSTRERWLAMSPHGRGMVAYSLRAADEVRDADALFSDIKAVKPDKDMIALAEKIIEQKAGEFDPSAFEDRYETALKALIARKTKGQKPVAAKEPDDTNVVDLMAALRASLGGRDGGEKGGKGKPAAKASSSKSTGAKPKGRKAG